MDRTSSSCLRLRRLTVCSPSALLVQRAQRRGSARVDLPRSEKPRPLAVSASVSSAKAVVLYPSRSTWQGSPATPVTLIYSDEKPENIYSRCWRRKPLNNERTLYGGLLSIECWQGRPVDRSQLNSGGHGHRLKLEVWISLPISSQVIGIHIIWREIGVDRDSYDLERRSLSPRQLS